MRTISKYMVLILITLQYLVGAMGFTVHHCCCKHVYHTTAIVTEIFSPYHIHECLRVKEMAEFPDKLMFRQWRHCGDYSDSMGLMKYSNEKNLLAPLLYLIPTDLLLGFKERHLLSVIESKQDNSHIFFNHVLKRRWQECDSLCIFLI